MATNPPAAATFLRHYLPLPSLHPRTLLRPRPRRLAASVHPSPPDETPAADPPVIPSISIKNTEPEEVARRRSWVEHGWAPWEEVMTPEVAFARHSLNEGEEVPLQSPESLEAFRMLTPAYREKMEAEPGYIERLFATRDTPEPLETTWAGRLPLRLVPPRDWPPPGWEVEPDELEFIREAHREASERLDMEAAAAAGVTNVEKLEDAPEDLALDRYKMFLKQYKEWVEANRDRLEQESYQYDQDYYPGRRKRGKDYREDMHELPFYYPGQICYGQVTTVHLYQGAFVDVGCVHDGWVPIKGNDWYWIRHHIKPGMKVYVEILVNDLHFSSNISKIPVAAKRDPYRFRFPLEMRFIYPNIDHLIFNRFDFPPIFHRKEDTNPEQLWREGGRPPIPRKKPLKDMEKEPLASDHPFVDTLWEWHNAEQMILDYEEQNPDKFKDTKYESTVDASSFDEENRVEYTEGYFKETLLKKKVVNVNIKELDLDAARAERQLIKKLKKEAEERGEEYKVGKLRRNKEMDEYDLMQWRRSFEEREALIRDICCRKALGLPIEEPGRYDVDETEVYGKDYYDPEKPMYRYDYWGEPKNTEKTRLERDVERHNQQVVGDAKKWCEMSYDDYIRKKLRLEAAEARERRRKALEPQEEEEEYDDGMDLDLKKMTDPRAPHNRFYITK
ncbi:Protein PLASTID TRANSCRIPTIONALLY ACTIVE 10 [Dichanthelium oligosanthes]|uniref:Protein PLASTID TRANSCRIPTIONALLY ACTIVE 10 n=1 Tax=Dichanthelium oligosanthes TaxID=888268 RepID=A0A1E5VJS1_9POAL|nr:Protein PLASTID TRANSCRIPTIONALLY ACTIVE 10 [Dichanthelium oligosanthes]